MNDEMKALVSAAVRYGVKSLADHLPSNNVILYVGLASASLAIYNDYEPYKRAELDYGRAEPQDVILWMDAISAALDLCK